MIVSVSYPPALMEQDEAAMYLRISPRTLAKLQAQSKVIPKAMFGKRMYLREDLDVLARDLPDWDD